MAYYFADQSKDDIFNQAIDDQAAEGFDEHGEGKNAGRLFNERCRPILLNTETFQHLLFFFIGQAGELLCGVFFDYFFEHLSVRSHSGCSHFEGFGNISDDLLKCDAGIRTGQLAEYIRYICATQISDFLFELLIKGSPVRLRIFFFRAFRRAILASYRL